MNGNYTPGYPSLAAFIARDRDKSTLIFKRFDRLAARNLLHLQSELARLQAKLDDMDVEDATEGESSEVMENKQCLRSWDALVLAAEDNPRHKERLELAKLIKDALKDYREAMIFESTLASLPRPTKKTLQVFDLEFSNKKRPNFVPHPTLGGSSTRIYEDRDDLVALKVLEHPDRLTALAQDQLAFLFESKEKRDGSVGYASDTRIAQFVVLLSIFLAALLLVGAIIGLYLVQAPHKQLGMIATFTTIFAAGVGLLTNARRPELFAATAAYAAVLVVFVSGNLGANKGSSTVGQAG